MKNEVQGQDTYMINPDTAYKTYCKTCTKNKTNPVDELEFNKGLVMGLSGSMSIACTHGTCGITKYPIDDKRTIWCLLVPCPTGDIRVIFGPKHGIDETVQNLVDAVGTEMTGSVEEAKFSPIDQF